MAWGASNSQGYFRDPSKWEAGQEFERRAGAGWLNLLNAGPVGQEFQKKLNDVGAGKISLQDALKGAGGLETAMAYTNPATANQAAAGQVENNDLFKGMFGAGGIQEGRQNAEKDLMSRGFSLQPEDYEAYGQASGNISRLFGQQENRLANALASRGLASGANGATGVAYSGLMGNKLEQLAQSQRQIANDRMSMNLQRLNSMQNAVNSGNQLAQSALQSQRNENQKNFDNYFKMNEESTGAAKMLADQNASEWGQQQQTGFSPTQFLGGAVSSGLGSLAGGLGTGIAANATGQTLGKKT